MECAMPDDIPVDVQASIAAANHAEALGDHAGRRAAASAALKSWTASMNPVPSDKPTTAVEAAARLAHLQKDAGWRSAVATGSGPEFKAFTALNEQIANSTDPVELALAGHAPPSSVDENSGSVLAEHDMPAVAAHLRGIGHPEHQVSELMHGTLLGEDFKPLPADEAERRVSNAELFITQAGRDTELRRRILSGDAAALEVFRNANETIALGKRGMP
jgi:hypothetical protein